MGASILSRTITTADKRLVLSNDQAARLIDIGTTWTKIRVGLRCSVDGATTITGTPEFAFGVCSGTTNKFGDATTTNFLGTICDSASWTYAVPTFGGINFKVIKKVGVTRTSGSSFSQNPRFCDTSQRIGIWLDIEKGSPNYTLTLFCPNASPVAADITSAAFLQAQEQSAPNTGLTSYGASTPIAFAADEVAGSFNAIGIFWNRTSHPMEISDAVYSRLS